MSTKEFIKYLDSKNQERLRVQLKIEKGLIVAMVFQYESHIRNRWKTGKVFY